jgi:peptide/nickel transport system substrate-binding protein
MSRRSFLHGLASGLAAALVSPKLAHAETSLLRVGKPFIASAADPAIAGNGWSLTSHGISQNLYTVARDGRVVPQLAAAASREAERTWVVRLKPDLRFSDGSPVTAGVVAEGLARSNERNPPARASLGRAQFRARDPLTLEIASERPVAIMPSVLAEWALVVYRAAGEQFHFTGPYRIAGMTPGATLDLEPNPHYAEAEQRPRVRIRYFAETESMALALEAGELDIAFQIPATALPRLRARPGTTTATITGGYQYLLLLNTTRPPFDDVRVRRAMMLGIDPRVLTQAARGGEAANGLFGSTYAFNLNEPYRTDPTEAARLLDEAGWRMGSDGFRSKDGRRLSLTLVGTTGWPDFAVYQPIIRAQLRAIGMDVVPRMVEAFFPVATSGEFDALFRTTHTAPTGDPGFFLNDGIRSEGSRNFGHYASAEMDRLIARLDSLEDPEARRAVALEAQRKLTEDAAVFSVAITPFHIGFSSRVRGYEIWGADYYIIRDDLRATG